MTTKRHTTPSDTAAPRISDDLYAAFGRKAHHSLGFHSPTFSHYGRIPREHTGEGGSISPPLFWISVPRDTRELVIVCEDLDAPREKPLVLWIVYRIAPDIRALPAGLPSGATLDMPVGARHGYTSNGILGYEGPLPPLFDAPHRYEFELFAVSDVTRFDRPARIWELRDWLKGKVLAAERIVGLYERTGVSSNADVCSVRLPRSG